MLAGCVLRQRGIEFQRTPAEALRPAQLHARPIDVAARVGQDRVEQESRDLPMDPALTHLERLAIHQQEPQFPRPGSTVRSIPRTGDEGLRHRGVRVEQGSAF